MQARSLRAILIGIEPSPGSRAWTIYEIVVQNHGRPGREMSLQLIGPRDRVIATGLIPASAFPANDTFREVHLPNGVEYEVDLLGDSVWDVWLNLPPDPWLGWMAKARDANALADVWGRMQRDARRGSGSV